jgi:hypothetical protein
MPARGGKAPHIDHQLDARVPKQTKKPINGMSRVPHGQQLPPRNHGALNLSFSRASLAMMNPHTIKADTKA